MDNTAKNRFAAYKMLAIQSLITLVVAAAMYGAGEGITARSIAVGAFAFIVPNAYFAKYALRHSAADSAQLAMRWFYVGEAIKVFVTALMFAMTFLWADEVNVAALFIAYIVMLIINLLGNSILMGR